jgi:hypothetical protein
MTANPKSLLLAAQAAAALAAICLAGQPRLAALAATATASLLIARLRGARHAAVALLTAVALLAITQPLPRDDTHPAGTAQTHTNRMPGTRHQSRQPAPHTQDSTRNRRHP